LVEYPPTLKPAPVKPYFFDIAFNYIGLEGGKKEDEPLHKVETVEEKPPAPAKRGWFWR
jgi:hypothetical protein